MAGHHHEVVWQCWGDSEANLLSDTVAFCLLPAMSMESPLCVLSHLLPHENICSGQCSEQGSGVFFTYLEAYVYWVESSASDPPHSGSRIDQLLTCMGPI